MRDQGAGNRRLADLESFANLTEPGKTHGDGMNSEIETLASMLEEAADLLRESGFLGLVEWFDIDAK